MEEPVVVSAGVTVGALLAEDMLGSAGSADGHSAVCARCHARLYAIVRAQRHVHIPLGLLGDTPGIRPSFHIHVASKAPWYTICDDLPQYAELPP